MVCGAVHRQLPASWCAERTRCCNSLLVCITPKSLSGVKIGGSAHTQRPSASRSSRPSSRSDGARQPERFDKASSSGATERSFAARPGESRRRHERVHLMAGASPAERRTRSARGAGWSARVRAARTRGSGRTSARTTAVHRDPRGRKNERKNRCGASVQQGPEGAQGRTCGRAPVLACRDDRHAACVACIHPRRRTVIDHAGVGNHASNNIGDRPRGRVDGRATRGMA